MNKNIKLDVRLSEIVKLLGVRDVVSDIGCDHGLVPNYLIENNLAKKVYATDISEDSLMKNIQFTRLRGNEKEIFSYLGDGIKPLVDLYFDSVIIAGMGGELIIKIIEDAGDLLNDKLLILQPMTARRELREYLSENGFIIERESIVRDENKFYEIIKATPGTNLFLEKNKYYFAKNLIDEKDEIFVEYIKFSLNTDYSILKNIESGISERSREKAKEMNAEIEILEGILDECDGK